MNSHYKDLLSIFRKHQVRYLIVGGYAVMRLSEPRFTKDLDIWVEPSEENGLRTYSALAEFGAPLAGVTSKDFEEPGLVFQIGVPPVRVDILTSVSGVEFHEAWQEREAGRFDAEEVWFAGRRTLIRNKRATGRPLDRIDADALENGG